MKEHRTSDQRYVTVAAVQCPLGNRREENIALVSCMVTQAARNSNAQIVLIPELFELPYFCRVQDQRWFAEARPFRGNETIAKMAALAAKLKVVLPIPFFERDGQAYYNSVAVADADGTVLGVYRKSHLPDGPGYQEKYYFRPGDTGFKTWRTRYGNIGIGICWDQWFPEAARSMALRGAEMLFYPTAIGSEPSVPKQDNLDPWQRVIIGHAVANHLPVVAANRTGVEEDIKFFGSSFIADARGDKVEEMGRDETGYIFHTFDLCWLEESRAGWGFFRDRRPDLYKRLIR